MKLFSFILNIPRLIGLALLKFCLSSLTSRHGKRIVFITSLYLQVMHIEKLRNEAVTKLNSIMHLAYDEASIHLPLVIRNIIWKGTNLSKELNYDLLEGELSDERAIEISKRVVEISPKWIHYGRNEDMVRDVFTLIQNGKNLVRC